MTLAAAVTQLYDVLSVGVVLDHSSYTDDAIKVCRQLLIEQEAGQPGGIAMGVGYTAQFRPS